MSVAYSAVSQLSLEIDTKTMYLASERPVAIDLFAGCGGLSLGFEQAGFDVAAAVEIDPIHAAVHAYNFPRCATLCASAAELSAADIRRRSGLGDREVDVVVGGAPCQGFSLIGKRALDDPRNGLVHHFVRLVVELGAKYFVFENVKGLTLGKHRAFLDEVIAAFGVAGYEVQSPYRVLNAAEYGVPQDRRRLFLLGARRGLPAPIYPESGARATVDDALADLPDVDGIEALRDGDSVPITLGRPSRYAAVLRGVASDPTDFGYERSFDPGLLTASMRTEHTDLSKRRFAATRHGKTEPVSRFLKLDPAGVCNTLRAGTDSARGAFTSPRPIHPFHDRVLTVREAARLHSYPDWFRFHATKWHGFREVGNSVPPLLARAVAARVFAALGPNPTKPTEVLSLGEERLLRFDMSAAAEYFGLPSVPIAQRRRVVAASKHKHAEAESQAVG
jgi:DNA (cytosine-5)-methyltransferase 1